MVNHDTAGSSQHQSNRRHEQPEDVRGGEDGIDDARVVEDERVEQDDDTEHLAAERRGVGEHETVVDVVDVHRDLLVLLS